MRYSTYDRELTAIYLAVKHFRYMLEGRLCHIYTDHKPLIFAFNQRPDRASDRQARQLDFVAQITTDIRYVEGSENIVADLLSRIQSIEAVEVNFDELARDQQTDEELQAFRNGGKHKHSLKLKPFSLPFSSQPVICDYSSNRIRPFVTKRFRVARYPQLVASWFKSNCTTYDRTLRVAGDTSRQQRVCATLFAVSKK